MGKKLVSWSVSQDKLYVHGPCKGCWGRESTFVPLYWEDRTAPPGHEAAEGDEDEHGRRYALFWWEQSVLKCVKCGHLSIGKWFLDPRNGPDEDKPAIPFLRYATLESIEPSAPSRAEVPASTPDGIVSLLREAEDAMACGVPRAAAALFRAILESTLKQNGYNERGTLEQRIEQAAVDRVLTIQLETRAHRCRLLGNSSLHEASRPTGEELEDIYGLVLLLIESFYRTRSEVEEALRKLDRIPQLATTQQGGPKADAQENTESI